MYNKLINEVPLVSINCLVYNHEPYLRDCFEGFVIQKTDFPFEILVHDDASTDKSALIISEYTEKYPSLFLPIYQKENQYSKGVKVSDTFQYPRAKGKYIALCEGDDYWTDPMKLQKQVDFLEANPEYGLVYSKVKVYKECLNDISSELGSEVRSLNELICSNRIPTLSTCFKKDLLISYINGRNNYKDVWLVRDYPMWIYFFANSKIHFFNEYFGVYRELINSASHSTDINKNILFIDTILDIQLYFIDKYSIHQCLEKVNSQYFATICNAMLRRNYINNIILKNKYKGLKKRGFIIYIIKILMGFCIGRKMLKLYWKIG